MREGRIIIMSAIKVLVVDDEVEVLNVIKTFLRNFDVITETSSLKAAEMIEKEKYDLYIVDYQMSGLNGIELLEEIKENYTDRNYVSILCTAYGTIHLFKQEFKEKLFDFFIEKPIEPDNFYETINKAIIKLGNIKNGK